MNRLELSLIQTSFIMLFSALLVGLAGLSGIIKKSPDEFPYSFVMPFLTLGGGALGIGTALFLILTTIN
jgi:hypothetical protein